jgi:acyl-CoA hydrolase/GNAT superfamily N-acetyltransferase
MARTDDPLAAIRQEWPDKFVSDAAVFGRIHRGDRIFIGTACGEPQYLVRALVDYVDSHPKAFFDTELMHVWTLGVAPYTDSKFRSNFRYNAFFIGMNARQAVNEGLADYTPVFLSQVPALFRRGLVPVDVALIQTSVPDNHGTMSLGVSVDIVKQAVESADVVVAQVNRSMPRTHGDGFVHVRDVDYLVVHDEPLLEYAPETDSEVAQRIGRHVASLVEDGDTIQVGYGAMPNAILQNLGERRHLGVHTELVGDGIVDLMRRGAIDNSRKSIDRGKAVATFCMGRRSTYEYLHDNPMVEFRTIDYTNDPRVIARHDNMVAINSALEIDLTGQATAESLGGQFFSGIGGQADFMRGAVLARNGRTILALPSTADSERTSRIVPFLQEGAGATLIRGDVQYVATEYGIAYLHGRNIRERAMELIAIAHPKFRQQLVEEARERNLIYADQAFIPGAEGEYPEELETWRTTAKGLELRLRPVRISDEPRLKDFFYALSDESMYRRFVSVRKDMPHERLQDFCVIDYTQEMVILAIVEQGGREIVVGLGQYAVEEGSRSAEVAFVVRDEQHNRGIATTLLRYLVYLANRQGLRGFTSEVLMTNRPMLRVFEKMGFALQRRAILDGDPMVELRMGFGEGE